MTAPTIDTIFDPPLPTDSKATFNTKAFTLVASLNGWSGEANAVAAYFNAMSDSVAAFDALANFQGDWSGLTGALARPATVAYGGNIYALTADVADVTAHTPGVSALWQLVRASSAAISHGAGTVSGAITDLQAVNAAATGAVTFFARSTAPSGWLKANGAAISRTTYAALFAVIGTTFGAGDGSTTFKLPDLRGEFMRGLDDGRGVDTARALGSSQLDAVQDHTHTVNGLRPTGGDNSSVDVGTGSTSRVGATGAMATGRSSTETRPRNVALLACIKY